MHSLPPFLIILTAAIVGTLQLRKARRFIGRKRYLSLGIAASNFVTSATIGLVLVFQGFQWPGPGLLIAASILLAIALWCAALIWEGPAEQEDRLTYIVTIVLMGAAVLAGIAVGPE